MINLKIVLVGDSGVGKTSLIFKFMTDSIPQTGQPTVNADFTEKSIVVKGHAVNLQLWDTAGSEHFRSLNSSIYRGLDCGIFVLDLTNRASFESLKTYWKENLLYFANAPLEKQLPLIVVANKAD